jgi:hypothetical protein
LRLPNQMVGILGSEKLRSHSSKIVSPQPFGGQFKVSMRAAP